MAASVVVAKSGDQQNRMLVARAAPECRRDSIFVLLAAPGDMLWRMTRRRSFLGLLISLGMAGGLQAEDYFFDSGGVRIHYVVEGSGEPVILIHGYLANIGWNWGDPGVIKALAGNYRVIALDNRGHGLSDRPQEAGAYGLKMTEDVIRLMDHLKIKKAHVVGYSMGGWMTARLLTDHPERFLTATLSGAGWLKEDADQSFLLSVADSLEKGKGLGLLLAALNPKDAPTVPKETLEAASKMLLWFNDPVALAKVARGMGQFGVAESKLRANKIPVLALIGELDPLKVAVDQFDGVLAKLKVVVIPGANHINTPGNPEFIKALKAFLAEHPERRKPPK